MPLQFRYIRDFFIRQIYPQNRPRMEQRTSNEFQSLDIGGNPSASVAAYRDARTLAQETSEISGIRPVSGVSITHVSAYSRARGEHVAGARLSTACREYLSYIRDKRPACLSIAFSGEPNRGSLLLDPEARVTRHRDIAGPPPLLPRMIVSPP